MLMLMLSDPLRSNPDVNALAWRRRKANARRGSVESEQAFVSCGVYSPDLLAVFSERWFRSAASPAGRPPLIIPQVWQLCQGPYIPAPFPPGQEAEYSE